MNQIATVQTVFDWLNSIAPFDTQESYDNAGLLIGAMNKNVTKVLVCLDVTP